MDHNEWSKLVELSSWRIATALAKRNPRLITVFIGHPGGGQSDVLWLLNRKYQDIDHGEIFLNRTGSIFVQKRFDGKEHHERDFLGSLSWQHYLASDHAEFVAKIERAAGLPQVKKSPMTTNRILTYQLFVHLLKKSFLREINLYDESHFTIRNGYFDSSSPLGSSRNKDINTFDFDANLFRRQKKDLFSNVSYRFWVLYSDNYRTGISPLIGFEESTGVLAYANGGKNHLKLMDLYNTCDRNLDLFLESVDQVLSQSGIAEFKKFDGKMQ